MRPSLARCKPLSVLFYLHDQFVYQYAVSIVYTSDWQKPTVCWTVSYILSIVVRHYSHKIIVFGDFEGSYCQSLARTFGAYSGSIVLSVFTNNFLTDYLMVEHRNAWIITMLWTGIFNYFMLKSAWRPKVKDLSSPKGGDLKKIKEVVV